MVIEAFCAVHKLSKQQLMKYISNSFIYITVYRKGLFASIFRWPILRPKATRNTGSAKFESVSFSPDQQSSFLLE